MTTEADVNGTIEDESPSPSRLKKGVRWGAAIVVVALLAALLPLVRAANQVETVPVDVEAARGRLTSPLIAAPSPSLSPSLSPSPSPSLSPSPPVESTPPPSQEESAQMVADGLETWLVIGSDARPGLGGSRADVLLLAVVPGDGSDPVLFSVPRDLWLDDPCRGGQQRINAALNGCGERANGFELTTIVVEDFTGLSVDHVVGVGFDGFREVIDAVGGIQVCVDNPVRDGALALPAGCNLAGGDQALAWVRSRHTQELVGGEWRAMDGVNDLTRNERQQELMLQLLARAGRVNSPADLYAAARGLGDAVSRDENISILDGVGMVRQLRGAEFRRFTIPVRDMTTSGGAQVLLPVESFATTWDREVGDPPLPTGSGQAG